MWVTRNLKLSVHCQKSATRVTAVLNQITRNFHYRDRHTYHTYLKLYKQYVRPHLEFASPAWSPGQKGDKDVLERVHEKAVKIVSGLKPNSYRERCGELKLETSEKRRTDQDLVLTRKMPLEARFRENGVPY